MNITGKYRHHKIKLVTKNDGRGLGIILLQKLLTLAK